MNTPHAPTLKAIGNLIIDIAERAMPGMSSRGCLIAIGESIERMAEESPASSVQEMFKKLEPKTESSELEYLRKEVARLRRYEEIPMSAPAAFEKWWESMKDSGKINWAMRSDHEKCFMAGVEWAVNNAKQ